MCSAVFWQARQPAVMSSVFPLCVTPPAGVEPGAASERGLTIVEPGRHLSTWLRDVSGTSDRASWVLRVAALVVFVGYLSVSGAVLVITNECSSLVFFGDLAEGSLVLIALSLVMWSSGLAGASWPNRLGLAAFGGVHKARRVGVNEPRRRDGRIHHPGHLIPQALVSAGTAPANETAFIEEPTPGSGSVRAEIFTSALKLLFAGHPAVGAAWWLRERGTRIRRLQFRAGVAEAHCAPDLTTTEVFAEWTPEFVLHEINSPEEVIDADPEDYVDDHQRYLWARIGKSTGHIRVRAFAPELGVHEDEAIGAAAIRITDHVGRDLIIIQGEGSLICTLWGPCGWVAR
jgi:Phenazine biosynthesis-like protein